jgi:hypothetical protein
MTTCFDLSFGHLQVVSSTLEYSQLRSIKAYNYIIQSTCVHQFKIIVKIIEIGYYIDFSLILYLLVFIIAG